MAGYLKAFIVTEPEENIGGVVFATSAIAARRAGASEWNDGELGGMSCRRAAWADKYADSRIVPAADMIAEGWWFECNCGHRINLDNLEERGLPLSGVIGSQNSMIFCEKACQDFYLARKARLDAAGATAIAMLEEIVLKRFPDADLSASGNHVYCTEHDDGAIIYEQVIVKFGFPGMRIGAAEIRLQREYGCYGPVRPQIYCCGGDRDAFEAWAASSAFSHKEG